MITRDSRVEAMMSGTLVAGAWGLLSGSALVLGAAIACLFKVPQRAIAAVMAFGAGVLISALSFELMEEAFKGGGMAPATGGFLAGAAIYTLANVIVTRRGGHDRKRSRGSQQHQREGAGLAIAVGALLDGIPESIVIGVSLIGGERVSLVAVAAVFLSNLPEGLSSAAGMRAAGRSLAYIFGVWTFIALCCAVGSMVGYSAFAGAPPAYVATANAVAAGAILAMIADTMMPEAFETVQEYAGLVTVAGFLAAFTLSKLAG